MTEILDFLQKNSGGILILFFIFLGIGILVHYTLWIFAKGRFSGSSGVSGEKKWNFVLADAAIKIINDFRHLLALLLVIVFSGALGYAIYVGRANVDGVKDALQAVMATLGGLIGSIIGYYFGESSVRAANTAPPSSGVPASAPPVQSPPATATPGGGITEAPQPPPSPAS